MEYKNSQFDIDRSDIICQFMGGWIEDLGIFGEQWRFDKHGTDVIFMKCPPFGSISRNCNNFHCDYKFVMHALKECHLKRFDFESGSQKYNEIIEVVGDFNYGSNHIMEINNKILEFIEIYNQHTHS